MKQDKVVTRNTCQVYGAHVGTNSELKPKTLFCVYLHAGAIARGRDRGHSQILHQGKSIL